VERTVIVTARQVAVGFPSLKARLVCGHRNERIQLRVVRLDTSQALFDGFGCARFARAQAAAEFVDRQARSTTLDF
jgi:hypothetical protein